MYLTFLCAASLFIAVSQALVGKVCKVESECDAGECCQILSEFMVMSRRQDVLLETIAPLTKTGTCQKYKTEGDHCGGFEVMNGYCGCAPGTYCHSYWVPESTTVQMVARSPIMPRPGFQYVSKCDTRTQ